MKGIEWIDREKGLLADINDTVWRYGETGLKEEKSAAFLEKVLLEQGFDVQSGAAGMETAFVASFGTEGPKIGFLAEYDALPGLSQTVNTKKETRRECPDSGHGCGHNALAAAILGGAIALSKAVAAGEVKGQVIVFGCPAEELLIGKVRMAQAGLFDGCDILFSCHPNDVSYVWARTSNAVWSGIFTFSGKTAHAAIDPQNGRSALDAVELMDVGANYLREHVTPDVRIHYVITEGGQVPNVVPAKAKVWYTVRAKTSKAAKDLRRRVELLAEGASVMTETSWEEETVSSCSEVLRNRVLEGVLLKAMKTVGAPAWEEADYAFAEELSKELPEGLCAGAEADYGLTKETVCRGLHTGIYDGFYREGEVMAVSTDVGDASLKVPTGVFSFASTVIGSPGHSWFYTACCGSSIAHKGVVMAAKVFVLAAEELLRNPELIKKAWAAFEEEKQKNGYQNTEE